MNRGSTLPTTIELIAGARCWQHRIQSVRRALETLHLLRPIAYFVFGIEQQIVGATITRGTIVLADEVIAAIGDVTGKTIRAIMARTDFGGWLKCTGAGHTNHSGNGKWHYKYAKKKWNRRWFFLNDSHSRLAIISSDHFTNPVSHWTKLNSWMSSIIRTFHLNSVLIWRSVFDWTKAIM